MNHVSVSPTDGNGPTQGQRKSTRLLEMSGGKGSCICEDTGGGEAG